MTLLYIRLSESFLTPRCCEKTVDRTLREKPNWFERWFGSKRKNPSDSLWQRPFRETNSDYHLERRFLL